MRPQTLVAFLWTAAAINSSVEIAAAAEPMKSPVPLVRAHAHNDYEHQRPLLDALDHGFCGVEADIWLVKGKLLVAHDRNKTQPERTLEGLYLEPLRQRVQQNGGRVYRDGPPVTLLIDIKSDGEMTYAALREVLKRYTDMLTEFRTNQTKTNAITVIISGNRPRETIRTQTVRYAGYDGRLIDVDSGEAAHFIPLISDNWRQHFKWLGIGPMPQPEREKLRSIVARCHAAGRKVRFWATPDKPEVWKELFDGGVDLINTDDLGGLQKFLPSTSPK
jgi:glycerophosphoryl diester phosphodiesterase